MQHSKKAKFTDFEQEISVPIYRLGDKNRVFEKWEHTKRNGIYYQEGSDDQ